MTNPAPNPDPIRFIDRAEVARRTALSKSVIYRLINEADFPKPVRIGNKCSRWVASEVDAWLRQRADGRESRTHVERIHARNLHDEPRPAAA